MDEPKKLDQSNLFKTVSTLSDLVSKWVNIYILYSQLKTTFYASLSCKLTRLMHFNTYVGSVQ